MPEKSRTDRQTHRPTTRQLLADAVKDRHHSLDQQAPLRVLLSGTINLADYIRALQLLRQCFVRLEPALVEFEAACLPAGLEPWQGRAGAIDADLQALGVIPAPAELHAVPVPLVSAGSHLGLRYVLEGSAQGGKHIAAHLAAALPALLPGAFRFWSMQQQMASRWPAFLTVLAQLDGDTVAQQQAIQAATRTFDVFLAVFSREKK